MGQQREVHRLAAGSTYWVHTSDGDRFRLDLSTPGEVWLLPLLSKEVVTTEAQWVRVSDPTVTVTRDLPLSLTVVSLDGEAARWVSEPVTQLVESSKSDLPHEVEWHRT